MTAPQLRHRSPLHGGVPGTADSWLVVDQLAIEQLGAPCFPKLDEHERASILRAEKQLLDVFGPEGWTPRIVHRKFWHRGPICGVPRRKGSLKQIAMPW